MSTPEGSGRPGLRPQRENPRALHPSGFDDRPEPTRMTLPAERDEQVERSRQERARWGRPSGKTGIFKLLRGKPKETSHRQNQHVERGRQARNLTVPEPLLVRMSSMPAMRTTTHPSALIRNNSSHMAIEGLNTLRDASPSGHALNTVQQGESATTDPLLLCSDYGRAIKNGPVMVPTGSIDALLRAQKAQTLAMSKDLETSGSDNKKKRAASPNPLEAVTTKVYVLTETGGLLQYAGEGNQDRKPEKVMQLSRSSAAMACDAVPGRHWVLHISETFVDDEPPPSARMSLFGLQKLGSSSRKGHENFLLIMESPDELDAWMVAVRRAIQLQGGADYRAESATAESSEGEIEGSINTQGRVQFDASVIPPAQDTAQAEDHAVGDDYLALEAAKGPLSHAHFQSNLTTKKGLLLRMETDSEAQDCGAGGDHEVPRITADGAKLEGGQQDHQNETAPHHSMTGPSLAANASSNSGNIYPPAPAHSHQAHRLSVNAQHSAVLRTPAPVTGRRRSSSVHSPKMDWLPVQDSEVILDRASPRLPSPSRSLVASQPEEYPGRHKTVTGLRRRPVPIHNAPSTLTTGLDELEPSVKVNTSHSVISDPPDRVGNHSPIAPDSQGQNIVIPPPDHPSSLVSDSQTLPAQSFVAGFRRIRPAFENGPVVLTPPESPEATEGEREVSVGRETLASSTPAPGTLTTAHDIEDGNQNLAEGKDRASFIRMDTEFASPDEDLYSPWSAVSDPSDNRISLAIPPARRNSRAEGIATMAPIAMLRPRQVDIPASFSTKKPKGFSLGLVGSLKNLPPKSRDVPPLPNASTAQWKHPSSNEVTRPNEKPVAISLSDDRKDSTTSVDSLASSTSSRRPPRQSSLLHAQGLLPVTFPRGASGSAPASGRATPQGQRKESVAVIKTAQLRAKLAAIDTSRLPQASNAVLLAPSPHPPPTGSLPALPLQAHRAGSPARSRSSSRDNRARAPSDTSNRNVSIAGTTPSRKAPDAPADSVKGSTNAGTENGVEGLDIIESTRSRRPRVERVTLAPMDNVAGMAERRRNRSPSPANSDGRGRSRSHSPDPRSLRDDKPLELIREGSVRSTAPQPPARADRYDMSEMEQIEADLNKIDEAASEKARASAIVPEKSGFSIAPSPEQVHQSTVSNAGRQESSEDNEDEGEEIPIGLGMSPRHAPPTASFEAIAAKLRPEATGAEAAASTVVTAFPKRTSSISYASSHLAKRLDRPLLTRGQTTGSLRPIPDASTEVKPLVPRADPPADNSTTAPDIHATSVSSLFDPPTRLPPPPPSTASSPSMSYIASPPVTLSPATPASRGASPNISASKFSPKTKLQLRARSRSSPRLNGHERQGARHERIELPGSEPIVAPSSTQNIAILDAPAMTPPPQMQASVTDFSQDDFFMWSMPVFNGQELRTPGTATFPKRIEVNRSKSVGDIEEETNFDVLEADRSDADGDSCVSPKSRASQQDIGPGPHITTISVSGLRLSFGEDAQTRGVPADGDVRHNVETGGINKHEGPRWSLFGAIEGIN